MVVEMGCVAVGIGFAAILQVIVWRMAPSNSPRIFLIFAFLCVGLCLSLAVSIFIFEASPETLLAVFSFSVLADVIYLHFYAGASRSVSVTLLIRMISLPGRSIRLKQLEKEYADSSRFDDRIQVMADSGWVDFKNGSATLTLRGKKVAKLMKGISTMLSGGLEG